MPRSDTPLTDYLEGRNNDLVSAPLPTPQRPTGAPYAPSSAPRIVDPGGSSDILSRQWPQRSAPPPPSGVPYAPAPPPGAPGPFDALYRAAGNPVERFHAPPGVQESSGDLLGRGSRPNGVRTESAPSLPPISKGESAAEYASRVSSYLRSQNGISDRAPEGVFNDANPAAPPLPVSGGGGGAYIPPQYGWTPHSRTTQTQTQTGVQLSPETETARKEAQSLTGEYRKASDKASEEDVQAARLEAETLRQKADQMHNDQTAHVLGERARSRRLESDRGDILSKTEEIENTKIDPQRYWSNKSTFSKMTSILGVALGGFLEGFKGVPNRALQMLQEESQRDIDAQKESLTNAKAGLASRKGLYADLVQQLGDERAAEAKTREMHMQSAVAELDAITAKSKSAHIREQAAKLRKDIAQSAAEEGLKFDQLTRDRTTVSTSGNETYGVLPGTGIGGGAAPAHDPELDNKRVITLPDGRTYYANNEQQVKTATDAIAHAEALRRLASEVPELRKKAFNPLHPQEAWQARNRLQEIRNELVMEQARPGVPMRSPEIHMYQQSAGNLLNPLVDPTRQLQQLAGHADARVEDHLRGAAEVRTGFARDRHGNVIQTGGLTGNTYAPAAAPGTRGGYTVLPPGGR